MFGPLAKSKSGLLISISLEHLGNNLSTLINHKIIVPNVKLTGYRLVELPLDN
jgi:hypothetical protein